MKNFLSLLLGLSFIACSQAQTTPRTRTTSVSKIDLENNTTLASNSAETEINSTKVNSTKVSQEVIPAADRLEVYLPELKNKRIGLIVNQASTTGKEHLVDVLLKNKIQVKTIFCPEHGFRGDKDAGEKIETSIDPQTKLPLISLYGQNKKPKPEQLKDIDLLVFDLQDVGVRFYTYISTLKYVLEAAGDHKIPVLVLDRPNPNGSYVDGPVLKPAFESFVGVVPIPVVYGLTIGELALMMHGEHWLHSLHPVSIKVIPNQNYTHASNYTLPIKPSPNLPNAQSIALYPSLCFFEGTDISVGRGTEFPFQVAGYPDSTLGSFFFTPKSMPGSAKKPMHENKVCYGQDYRRGVIPQKLDLSYLLYFYHNWKKPAPFFNAFFDKLAGTDLLKQQILSGKTEKEIRKSWEQDLNTFRGVRKKYLLYRE